MQTSCIPAGQWALLQQRMLRSCDAELAVSAAYTSLLTCSADPPRHGRPARAATADRRPWLQMSLSPERRSLLAYSVGNLYHCSAVVAAAVDTLCMPWRVQPGAIGASDLHSVAQLLVSPARS